MHPALKCVIHTLAHPNPAKRATIAEALRVPFAVVDLLGGAPWSPLVTAVTSNMGEAAGQLPGGIAGISKWVAEAAAAEKLPEGPIEVPDPWVAAEKLPGGPMGVTNSEEAAEQLPGGGADLAGGEAGSEGSCLGGCGGELPASDDGMAEAVDAEVIVVVNPKAGKSEAAKGGRYIEGFEGVFEGRGADGTDSTSGDDEDDDEDDAHEQEGADGELGQLRGVVFAAAGVDVGAVKKGHRGLLRRAAHKVAKRARAFGEKVKGQVGKVEAAAAAAFTCCFRVRV